MEARDFLATFGKFEYINRTVAPPWKLHPNVDPHDLFWRMGTGEDVIDKFLQHYNSFDEVGRTIFRLSNPPPYTWEDIYE